MVLIGTLHYGVIPHILLMNPGFTPLARRSWGKME